MIIELLLFINNTEKDAPTLDDLAFLTQDFCIDDVHENIEFVIRIISTSEHILELVERKSHETRSSSYIIISDQLVTKETSDNNYTGALLFDEISNRLRHTKSFCGFIGIFPEAVPDSSSIDKISIDEYATFKHRDIQLLRNKLLNVVHRIWLKSPVAYHEPHRLGAVNSIEISSVSNQHELNDCLRLRGQVYESLGYVSENQNNGMETDFYDPVSFHFRAVDRENGNKTVGTMRLIVPSLPAFRSYKNLSRPEAKWFDGISEKAQPVSLPVFQSFQYFRDPQKSIISEDKSIRSTNVCEISRVIVSPEYRGMGISKLLMNHAITVAQQLKRKYVWLECAPHHIEMYEKFGFTVKNHGNGYFYERVQRFDTWAVAMYLKLENNSNHLINLNESSATCYYLPITKGRAENCTLRFQYFDKPADKIKNVFEQPLFSFDTSTPLKELIPSTLTSLNIEQFVKCLKQVFDDIELEPNKLSFIQRNGRNHVFNKTDIKTGNRGKIETRLYQWLG